MLHDSNVLSCFFLPITFIILLAIMMYIHKRQLFKYIYVGNILCLITAVVCYVFIDRHPVGQPYSASWMEAIPFVWLFTIFGGYFWFIASTITFLIEVSRRNMLAKVLLGFIILCFALLTLWSLFMFFGGIWVLRGTH